MTFSKKMLFLALGLVSEVMGHGAVYWDSADGVQLPGYWALEKGEPGRHPRSSGNNWLTPEQIIKYGPVTPKDYHTPDIICAKGATNPPNSLTVVAGHDVTVHWTKWPFSHHGPMIEYLANCNGDCSTVDKTKLRFNKISEQGLLDPNHRLIDPNYNVVSGYWASDKFREADDTWIIRIPAGVAPGNYVLRQEVIALHDSMIADGTQNYPQCFNLKVTGSGSDSLPDGTLGVDLYTGLEPGINDLNIFIPNGNTPHHLIQNYTIPGPPLHVFGGSSATGNPNLQGFTTSAKACTPSGGVAPTYTNISITYPPSTPTDIAASLSAAEVSVTSTPTANPTAGQLVATPTSTMGTQSGVNDKTVSGGGDGNGSGDNGSGGNGSGGNGSGGNGSGNGSGDGTVSMATLAALKEKVDALCEAFKTLTGQGTQKRSLIGREHPRDYKKAYAALLD